MIAFCSFLRPYRNADLAFWNSPYFPSKTSFTNPEVSPVAMAFPLPLKSKVPIAIKVSPDLNDEQIDVVSSILLDQEIEIIIVSNTSDRNRDKLNNINKLEKGGLSGKPLYQVSNNIISKFYKLLGNKIKIIGVGGVDSGEAAFEKIIRGASLVQLYTGMVYKGPGIASLISSELIDILKNKGFKNISEAVGTKY